MPRYDKAIRGQLRQCASTTVSDCGLTVSAINGRKGNPAGTTRQDIVTPAYRGKVKMSGDKILIDLKLQLTGHMRRAKSAIAHIKKMYATQNVIVNFTMVSQGHDLRIHGATLAELAIGLKSCTCEGMLNIGGWAPSYKHFKWGDALLLNPYVPRDYWKMSDAHEFGHKLGLMHRENLGMMDYWNEDDYPRRDPRKSLPSEKARIARLYL